MDGCTEDGSSLIVIPSRDTAFDGNNQQDIIDHYRTLINFYLSVTRLVSFFGI